MGFFHTEKWGKRFALVDPQGKPFFALGMNHIGDGLIPVNLREKYGSFEHWIVKGVRSDILDWGFNALGSTEAGLCIDKTSGHFIPWGNKNTQYHFSPEWSADRLKAMDMPYIVMFGYPEPTFEQAWRMDKVFDPFSGEFGQAYERLAEAYAPLADDPNLIGYNFSWNLPWYPDEQFYRPWVAKVLEPVGRTPARLAWIDLMRELYVTPERYAEAWLLEIKDFDELADMPFLYRKFTGSYLKLQRDTLAFARRMAQAYYRTIHECIRRHDKNHLILGDRLSVHMSFIPDYALEAMAPYVDVLCVNHFGSDREFIESMGRITPFWDKPIMVSDLGYAVPPKEWRFYPGCTWVGSQRERGTRYREFLSMALQHPRIVGCFWCGYMDTESHHMGLKTIHDEPHTEAIDAIREANQWARAQAATWAPGMGNR